MLVNHVSSQDLQRKINKTRIAYTHFCLKRSYMWSILLIGLKMTDFKGEKFWDLFAMSLLRHTLWSVTGPLFMKVLSLF